MSVWFSNACDSDVEGPTEGRTRRETEINKMLWNCSNLWWTNKPPPSCGHILFAYLHSGRKSQLKSVVQFLGYRFSQYFYSTCPTVSTTQLPLFDIPTTLLLNFRAHPRKESSLHFSASSANMLQNVVSMLLLIFTTSFHLTVPSPWTHSIDISATLH